jgi:hypothetical protein
MREHMTTQSKDLKFVVTGKGRSGKFHRAAWADVSWCSRILPKRCFSEIQSRDNCDSENDAGCRLATLDYWIALPTEENTLFALAPIKRTVPTTITRTTASITAYSAISWPRSSDQS